MISVTSTAVTVRTSAPTVAPRSTTPQRVVSRSTFVTEVPTSTLTPARDCVYIIDCDDIADGQQLFVDVVAQASVSTSSITFTFANPTLPTSVQIETSAALQSVTIIATDIFNAEMELVCPFPLILKLWSGRTA